MKLPSQLQQLLTLIVQLKQDMLMLKAILLLLLQEPAQQQGQLQLHTQLPQPIHQMIIEVRLMQRL